MPKNLKNDPEEAAETRLTVSAFCKRDGRFALLVLGALLTIGAAFLLSTVQFKHRAYVRIAGRETMSLNNLRNLSLGILNASAIDNRLPPPVLVDDSGQPLHSWRVLILPYLDEETLFEQIDLTKPWDHPVNQPFHDQMPDVFRTPLADLPSGKTTYLAVVGEQCYWKPTPVEQPPSSFGEGKLLLIEAPPEEAVCWMQPTDLDPRQLLQETKWLADQERKITIVGTANGAVRKLKTTVDRQTINRLVDMKRPKADL